MSDPLASTTIKSFMDYVEYFLPEAVLLENVSGFGMEGSAFSYLSQRFEQLNENRGTLYTLNVWRLNAANYGVPQARQRYFVVTHRGGQLLAPPLATHGNEKCLKPLSTAWDAIWKYNDIFDNDDSLKPRGTWGALLPSIPEGSNYLFHTPKGEGRPLFGYRTRYWSFLLKLAKNRPSWTLLSSPGSATGPFHWKSRMLAIPEMLCLQSFSEKHPVSEDYYKARRQIGNAVPPLLAEVLGRHIAKTLFNEEILGSPKYLRKRKQPAPEPVQEVPEYYLTQEGDHQDHPGAGKGPAAHKNALEEESPG